MYRICRHFPLLLLAVFLVGCRPSNETPRTVMPPSVTPPLLAPPPTDTPNQPPTETVEPYIFPPTVTARPSACAATPRATRLTVAERGVVVEDNEREISQLVNVRSGPGTGNRVVAQLNIGEVFLVLDGPECSLLYAWYQVQVGETTGWIAEGDAEAYYVAPYLPP